MTNSKQVEQGGKNQRIVTLGIAELGMASILFVIGGIFVLLEAFQVHLPFRYEPVPVPAIIGFVVSLGWILVSWKLIQSADKAREIRQRRRFVLYWTGYSCLVALFNIGVLIWFIVLTFKRHAYSALIISICVSIGILLVRGIIFFAVFVYSKELLFESKSSLDREIVEENGNPESEMGQGQDENNQEKRTVIVTPV